jgi:alpha-D-ribose 1-methylphosphonate 5-triphosphate synthase subunit PhnH
MYLGGARGTLTQQQGKGWGTVITYVVAAAPGRLLLTFLMGQTPLWLKLRLSKPTARAWLCL